MKFEQALKAMKNGEKVKLPSWGGYWYWDEEKQTVMMKCRAIDSDTGKDLLDIRETQRVEYTLANVMSDEWVIADESNTTILGGTPTFNFGEAIKYLKRGMKVARKGWNGKGQYISYVDFYCNDKFRVMESEIMDGTLMPCLMIHTNYNGLATWVPSITDLFAEDWVFVE